MIQSQDKPKPLAGAQCSNGQIFELSSLSPTASQASKTGHEHDSGKASEPNHNSLHCDQQVNVASLPQNADVSAPIGASEDQCASGGGLFSKVERATKARTIDDLVFPAVDAEPVAYLTYNNLSLPRGVRIPAGTEIKLSHTGLQAVVEYVDQKLGYRKLGF